MELTPEQTAIIQSTGDIKINAVAGSGKTTTVIEYARTRPADSRILYLAFNKSVKLDAQKKFLEKGLKHIRVETAHSLAYKNIVPKHGYTVRNQGYKTNEIAELLNVKGNGEKHAEYIVANHINKFIAYFCNSDKRTIAELDYLELISDRKAKAFVKTFYSYIESQCELLLNKMRQGEIEITHDFYLKQFQLSNPKLNADYILFDEGQDASPAMLDVFFRQQATKVIVGDTHQQIYSWRFAVNSLEKADYPTHHLSTSFRFGQDIADLAESVLTWKKYVASYEPVPISGKGTTDRVETKAVIGRTNLGLLLKAIEYVTETPYAKDLYFEGNFNSYTYADEGASLYDVLNLYNSKHYLIRDKLIRSMNSIDELEDYIEKTEDPQLGMMVSIVLHYKNEIVTLLQTIRERHVDKDEKEKAAIIFSTVHRCKGMEYDQIELVNDFITEKKLEALQANFKPDDLSISKLNEEINLLYVAVTRTRNRLYIPESLLPAGFAVSPNIELIATPEDAVEDELIPAFEQQLPLTPKAKAWSAAAVREHYRDAYRPWTEASDAELEQLRTGGLKIKELAVHFGRTEGAIRSRMNKLSNDKTA